MGPVARGLSSAQLSAVRIVRQGRARLVAAELLSLVGAAVLGACAIGGLLANAYVGNGVDVFLACASAVAIVYWIASAFGWLRGQLLRPWWRFVALVACVALALLAWVTGAQAVSFSACFLCAVHTTGEHEATVLTWAFLTCVGLLIPRVRD